MLQSHNPTNATDKDYAIHFHEDVGPGYLLVSRLAAGSFGTALLVLSLRDNQLYVRKIDKLAVPKTTLFTESAEVRLYTRHPNIPKLISSSEHDCPIPLTTDEGATGVKTATTWQFCNGGTLGALFGQQLAKAHSIAADGESPNGFERLPEAFIWKFLSTMLNLLIHIHRRGVCHNDIHENNIFLHWPSPSSSIPEAFLGDFGLATSYPQASHPNHLINMPWLIENFSQLRTPARSALPFSSSQPQVDSSPFHSLIQFYKRCVADHENILNLTTALLFNTPFITARHRRQINNATSQTQPLNSYSPALVQCIADYATILAPNKSIIAMNPRTMMSRLKWLAGKVTGNERSKARAAPAAAADVMRDFRPKMPVATPALWRSFDAVGVRRNDAWGFRVHGVTGCEWSIDLDPGTFQILRVRDVGEGVWKIVDDDSSSSSSEEDENRGSNDGDSDGNGNDNGDEDGDDASDGDEEDGDNDDDENYYTAPLYSLKRLRRDSNDAAGMAALSYGMSRVIIGGEHVHKRRKQIVQN